MGKLLKLGPKKADHPSIGKRCSLCEQPFKAGDYTTLLSVEGGFASKEEEEKAMIGLPYNCEAEEVHYDCAIK